VRREAKYILKIIYLQLLFFVLYIPISMVNKTNQKGTKMNLETFENWLQTSRKGDILMYHKGFLAKESDKNYELRKFAKNIRDIEEKKNIIKLFQKKIALNDYEYLAVRI